MTNSSHTTSIASPLSSSTMPLHRVCGPLYNAFIARGERGEEPCRFFEPATTVRQGALDEDLERWDGMA